ncbi:MAG: EAL domain-containing protein [Halomonas sp.]|nr:bifunctional diguanylate cyclase/phosphodiesterase [Halomonas sp.]TVP44179.1 MAG: EAL domain-containing protein [Halomonas sp.]
MDINNRELALQAGLLILLVTTVLIGAGSFLLGFFPDLHQPQSLALLPDSALVLLLSGLGLSSVMVNFKRCRQAAAILLMAVASYTLLHNALDESYYPLSLLSNHPRLPNQVVPIVVMASLCLWIGPQGRWQWRIWQLSGLLLWIIGCITFAIHFGWSLPGWVPRASGLIPGFFCFFFGLAMIMVSQHIPHLKASLSSPAVLAGILGVSLSISGWFLVGWNQHQETRHSAKQSLEGIAVNIAQTLTSRTVVLERLAERWSLVFADNMSRNREVERYLADYPSILAIAYFNPQANDVWRRARHSDTLVWLDDQLNTLSTLTWLNQQRNTAQWAFPDYEHPTLALLSIHQPDQPYQLVTVVDIALLLAQDTSVTNGAFALHINHVNGHLVDSGNGLLPATSPAPPPQTLADHTAVLPGGTVINLALSELPDPPPNLANYIAAGVGLSGLLLTFQLVFSLALISARAQRTNELSKAKKTLQDSEQRFRSLFIYNPDAVFSLDVSGYHLSVNQSVLDLLEIDEAQIIGTHWQAFIPPESYTTVDAAFQQALKGSAQRFELEVISQHGHARQLDISFLPTVAMGQVVGVYGIAKDMTVLRQKEAQLRIYQRSLEASSNGILICEALQDDYPIIYVNPAFVAITGYPLEEVKGHNCRLLQGKDTDPKQIADIQLAFEQQRDIALTIRNYRKNGQAFWNNLFLSPVKSHNGQVTHFVGSITDISERRDHENALAFHATHDALTGLGNRALFEDRLRHDVELAKRHEQQLAVLFIDLDEFKPINDTLGHDIGDQVLIHVAQRLKQAIRPSDTLCRFGGDEFVLLLPDLNSPLQAEEIAERLLVELALPYRIERHELYLSASIGIALNDKRLLHSEELLQQADMAMYKAKQHGRNTFQTFTQDINQKLTQRVTLRNDLQEAILNDQFALHYQPLLTQDGKVQGLEALVRWNHPTKGPISPGLFIPIAEETGQIIALSQWVMDRAAQDFLILKPLLPAHCRVAINLSPMQFHRPSFFSTLLSTLEATGLNPNSLELELTEGILMNDTDAAIEKLHALRNMGISIAIDDFGTGFSSLSYLRHLPVDKVKIDRSFITNISENSKDAAVVQGIIALAHHLDLMVVAEGVETLQQHQQLIALDCDVFQGYLFARPMPFEALQRWLSDHSIPA